MTDHKPFFHKRIGGNASKPSKWGVFETAYTRAPYLTCPDEDRAAYVTELLNEDREKLEALRNRGTGTMG